MIPNRTSQEIARSAQAAGDECDVVVAIAEIIETVDAELAEYREKNKADLEKNKATIVASIAPRIACCIKAMDDNLTNGAVVRHVKEILDGYGDELADYEFTPNNGDSKILRCIANDINEGEYDYDNYGHEDEERY